MSINIDDFPGEVLVEILCRLACYKFIIQCKCVSKSWCTIISKSYFVGRFLRLQIDKQTPIVSRQINKRGEELHATMSLSPAKLLTPTFKKLVSFHDLKEEPIVISTYNDLVLCCATQLNQRDYYICNPYTTQWVALPPSPTQCPHKEAPAGIICDVPYYYNRKEDNPSGSVVQLNYNYRCKVVRLVPRDWDYEGFDFNVEIFSSETGEWRESVVSFPVPNINSYLANFSFNGMLYWANPIRSSLVGLDPFRIINGSNRCHDFIEFDKAAAALNFLVHEHVSVCGGRLRMCYFDWNDLTVSVWEQSKEEEDHDLDQMVDGRRICWKNKGLYSLDQSMLPPTVRVRHVIPWAFDPNNDDILYIYTHVGRQVIMCNIRTGEWSKIHEIDQRKFYSGDYHYPLVIPWWPTPVPGVP